MTLRLRYGPHAGEAAVQVLLRDPQYCLWWLADRPDSALAAVFQDLVQAFDAHVWVRPCSACGRDAAQALALAGTAELVPYCVACSRHGSALRPAGVVCTYEDAVRHVAETCQRGHRVLMRRIILALARLKGAPERLTEVASEAWLLSGLCYRATGSGRCGS